MTLGALESIDELSTRNRQPFIDSAMKRGRLYGTIRMDGQSKLLENPNGFGLQNTLGSGTTQVRGRIQRLDEIGLDALHFAVSRVLSWHPNDFGRASLPHLALPGVFPVLNDLDDLD